MAIPDYTSVSMSRLMSLSGRRAVVTGHRRGNMHAFGGDRSDRRRRGPQPGLG
jgi:hypothetical protein